PVLTGGLRVWTARLRVLTSGLRVWTARPRVWTSGLRVWTARLRGNRRSTRVDRPSTRADRPSTRVDRRSTRVDHMSLRKRSAVADSDALQTWGFLFPAVRTPFPIPSRRELAEVGGPS